MDDARMLDIIAAGFVPAPKDEWDAIAKPSAWSEFIDHVQRALCDRRALGSGNLPIESMGPRTPLLDCLADAEVKALFAPPDHEGLSTFAARHFTGGLPLSAMPIESLYAPWSEDGGLFRSRVGLYRSDVALYLRTMSDAFAYDPPARIAAYPDHLSAEIGFAAHLIRSGHVDEANLLFHERTDWLTDYRSRLVAVGADAAFHLALVDILIGLRAGRAHRFEDEGREVA